jgi:DNA (cytosine-5)-methyltransferase 1
MKNSFITVTDQFCGAGGSSQGARKVLEPLGGEIRLALNHWKLAIETHNTNFPDTLHDCTDISACDPRRYPSTDILITSPECTNHSLAKGQKQVKKQLDLFDKGILDPSAERSRATMWDVVRFAEYHRYNAIIVENVVDARKWVPFDSWLMAMHSLGYNHKCVYLNSMHCHPTPQSRDRMYIVFWKKGNKAPDLEYRPLAYCPKCGNDVHGVQTWKRHDIRFGKYRQQYVYCCPNDGQVVEPYYYAAFNCIDWSDIGKRIGDRSKPLSENTIRRIEYGLKKYGQQPMYVTTRYSSGIDCRVKPLSNEIGTQPGDVSHALLSPFIIKGEHTMQEGYVRSAAETIQTQTVRQSMALVTPWIIEMNRTGESKPMNHPTATFTAGGVNHSMVTMPLVVENKGQSMSKPIASPSGAVTTIPHLGIVSSEAWKSFIHSYYGQTTLGGIHEAIGTLTTKERHTLVSYQQPVLEDCYYRMLKPHEIKLAMAFERNYIVLGSGKDQVRQLGNAVTPPAMEWLVRQVVNSLM